MHAKRHVRSISLTPHAYIRTSEEPPPHTRSSSPLSYLRFSSSPLKRPAEPTDPLAYPAKRRILRPRGDARAHPVLPKEKAACVDTRALDPSRLTPNGKPLEVIMMRKSPATAELATELYRSLHRSRRESREFRTRLVLQSR